MIRALKLKPALKEIIWGGQDLKKIYKDADMGNIAEAWLLSTHRDGQSLVSGGLYEGQPLSKAIDSIGFSALGTKAAKYGEMPILIKLIDAKERLSVQVHPDDAYARENENDSGKTEAWLILDCEDDSELIFGFKEDITKDELKKHIETGDLLSFVNRVKVKKGDVVYIPSGTLHAIGEGILLAEVQQSSNTTYRVFDYNRKDKDGNLRELHIEKAIDVLNTKALIPDFSPAGATEDFDGFSKTLLVDSEHFCIELVEVGREYNSFADETSFVSLVITEGEGFLVFDNEEIELSKGDSIFIAADAGDFKIKGFLSVLRTHI